MKPKLHRKRRWIVPAVLIVLAVLLMLGLSNGLRLRNYRIESSKLSDTLHVALLTDLHSCDYGENQRELIELLEKAEPDLVLLGGDILDDEVPHDKGWETIKALTERYPCYYVSGNHEYMTGQMDTLKAQLRDYGVTVLEGDCEVVEYEGQCIQICGADDPHGVTQADTLEQVAQAGEAMDVELFSILLVHRPELIEQYLPSGFDLILAGHAHGGQWRIPGILNGLFAPHQGLFPRYAGGEYPLGETTFVVSRGLARESTRIPRIFNPPELVILELAPKATGDVE